MANAPIPDHMARYYGLPDNSPWFVAHVARNVSQVGIVPPASLIQWSGKDEDRITVIPAATQHEGVIAGWISEG